MMTWFKITGALSRETPISKELEQGHCITPSLFKIYLSKFLSMWRKNIVKHVFPSEIGEFINTFK